MSQTYSITIEGFDMLEVVNDLDELNQWLELLHCHSNCRTFLCSARRINYVAECGPRRSSLYLATLRIQAKLHFSEATLFSSLFPLHSIVKRAAQIGSV